MADLYDTKKKKLVRFDNDAQITDAIASGTFLPKKGEKLYATNPLGEKTYIPSEQAKDAITQGYVIHGKTTELADDYVRENEGLSGAAKVFFGQAVDEAALGIPELIYDKTKTPLEVAKKEALKKHFSALNIAGGVTGAAASFFYGGPAFKAATKAGEATGKAVTKALSARAAGEVSEKGIKKAAEKIIGTGVEGALLSAPYAFTEAVLGDPDDAAETLMYGVGLGSLFGGVSEMAGGLSKLAKQTKDRVLTDSTFSNADVAKKLNRWVTGVPEDSIENYVDMVRNNRHLNVKDIEPIKNELDEAFAKVNQAYDDSLTALNTRREQYRQSLKESVFELRQRTAPETAIANFMERLDAQKAVLGRMSQDADKILERMPGYVGKGNVVKFIDKISDSLGVGKGKVALAQETKKARSNLQQLKEDIKLMPEKGIDGPLMRDIMREVRKNIKWDRLSGEFNETSNKVMKEFTESLSEGLKKASPEYAAKMKEMQEIAEILQKTSKRFGGDPTVTRGRLDRLFTKSGKEDLALITKFDKLTNSNVLQSLNDTKKARELLDSMAKGKDIGGVLLPQLRSEISQLEKNVQANLKTLESVKPLTKNRTQAAIRNMGRKDALIETRKALENLSSLSGKNFLRDIKDYNSYIDFFKERTQGSRRTLAGTAFGALVGGLVGTSFGPLGAAAGAAIGSSADIYAGRFVKYLIDKNPRQASLLFTEQAMKKSAEKIDRLPEIIKRMSEAKKVLPTKKTTALEATSRIFRYKDDKDEKELKQPRAIKEYKIKKIERIRDDMIKWISNPDLSTTKISELVKPIGEEGAPVIAERLSAKMGEAISYLYQEVPKPVAPDSLFAPKAKYEPSEYEMNKFLQKAQVVSDPFSVFDEMESGTITMHHMDALRTIYPGLHRYMVEKITDYAAENPTELNYQERLRLSILMDSAIDQSLRPDRIRSFQQVYAKEEFQDQDLPGREQIEIQGDLGQSLVTNSQRLA